jgi:hypothetical protein
MSRWTQIPAARSSAPVLKIRVYAVLGALVVAALCGVFATVAWLANNPDIPDPVPQPQALAEAAVAADAFLTGQATTLAVAEGVDRRFGSGDTAVALPGATRAHWASFTVGEVAGRTYEVHRFVVAGSPPRQLWVTVELTTSGPILAASPAVGPLPVAPDGRPALDWRELPTETRVTDDLRRVAGEWAAAYAADDRDRLRSLTGDLEARTYAGLGGFTVESATVVSTVELGDSGDWVARVRVVLVGAPPGEGLEGFRGVVEFDLRVADPATGNPKVVAWGPAGSGPTLVRFANAFISGS